MKKRRFTYAALFGVLLIIEIVIALFIHDSIIRPYVGDVLVTTLLCCFCRTIVPTGVRALPLYVFLFAAAVEFAQYCRIVQRLGLESNAFFSTLLGTTFSAVDLICYGVGCLLFWLIERAISKNLAAESC